MQFQRLTFQNAQGKTLSARLDLPLDEKPAAFAIFAHCFTCSKNLNAVIHINQALAMKGIAVLRFDFTGLGESEGDFRDTNFTTNVTDLISASEFLRKNYEAPKLLIGHSMGGAAVLQAAAKIPSTAAVATIGAPADPNDVNRLLGGTADDIRAQGEAEISLGGRLFKLNRQFLADLEKVNMQDTIKNLKKPLLVLHSPMDETVGIENAYDIFKTAEQPKSFFSLDQADHLLTNKKDSHHVGSILAAWAGRYLDIPEEKPPQRDLSDNRLVVRTGKAGFQTEIIANEHRLIADEPIAVGGANTGPNPYDYLVAALGACTSMTLRMYADRKKWPLDAVMVRLKHQKIHADDCQGCENKDKNIDHIEREIELEGPLSREQKERLMQIADRCPVHRTLHSEIAITTHLKE